MLHIQQPTPDYKPRHHLEFLDLLTTDNNHTTISNNLRVSKGNTVTSITDAEFYGFDDFESTKPSTHYRNGHYSIPEELSPPSDTHLSDSADTPTVRSDAIMRHSKSEPQFTLHDDDCTGGTYGYSDVSCYTDDCMKKSVSRNSSSGSSVSTSSSSSGTAGAMSNPLPLLPWQPPTTGLQALVQPQGKQHNKKRVGNARSTPSVLTSNSSSKRDSVSLLSRRSLSTQSFKFSQRVSMDTDHVEVSSSKLLKARADESQMANRTEQLLQGIVKLVEDDVITGTSANTSSAKQQSQPKHSQRRKLSLHASKSIPLISKTISENAAMNEGRQSSQSKPVSPVSTHRKFIFSRRGSFSYQHSHDTERKNEKKSKSHDKLNHVDPKAFLEAVERFDVDRVAYLLSVDKSSINSTNLEGMTAMDIAVLTNHVPMINVLSKYGARATLLESHSDNNLCTKLQKMIQGAEQQMKVLKTTPASGNAAKDSEKKLNQWEFKHRLFKRMKSGYDQAGLPGQPQNVKLNVTSDSSLSVRFDGADNAAGAVVTRYKVEWSNAQNFKPLTGETFLHDLNDLQYEIAGLQCGTPYYVRVTAWNMKGFGRSSHSDPAYAIPSSWRDVESIDSRASSYDAHHLCDIISKMKKQRALVVDLPDGGHTAAKYSPQNQRKQSSSAPIIRGLRGLFSTALKFQKTLKRGIYLACVCYCDDKILVTTEDHLPMVEVDDTFTGTSIQGDFDWFMKVLLSSYDTVKQLKHDLEKLAELSRAHLKSHLISALLQLLDVIGTQELGKLFYRPISDGNGSVVFVMVNQLSDPKQMANISSSVKWQSQSKLVRNNASTEPLLPMLKEMIFFHRVSMKQMEKGLYLGYLHIRVNAEALRLMAPESTPSALPFVKIRDCPNVSKPEWQSLINMTLSSHNGNRADTPDTISFKKQLMKSAKKLGDKLCISAEDMAEHRFYDIEVIEFSKDVSFIILVPPRSLVCSVQPQKLQPEDESKNYWQREYMEIPVKAFEMMHLNTYHSHFMTCYSRTACLLDLQLISAQQALREAFHHEEVEQSKRLLEATQSLQQQVEDVWRSTRWLMEVITFARDKNPQGISLTKLYNCIMEQSTTLDSCGRSSDDGYHSDKISVGGSTGSSVIGDKLQQCSATTDNNNTLQSHKNNNNNSNGPCCDSKQDVEQQQMASKPLDPGVLRVYAAYNSGLTKGTSVMLHVTPKTSAREVINLVVMQLNHAVMSKGMHGPVYSEHSLAEFCLVAVIGPRERVLRDDYRLLQLQNPWTKGKLYVRLKNNLLAALEHGETTDV